RIGDGLRPSELSGSGGARVEQSSSREIGNLVSEFGLRPGVRTVELDAEHRVFFTELPQALRMDDDGFRELWDLHPAEFHRIRMGGREVRTPRWQQAFGRDYVYTGNINRARPIPSRLSPLVEYAQREFDPRINGLLVNWYDAAKGHYIGRHRDTRSQLMPGAPIVTMSFGAARTFRLRPWKGTSKIDTVLEDGTITILPYDTNLAFTHEVPLFAADEGTRVSVTLRAFR
ncbi:MAG: alpha-ketoglutarate-dependent dioxygenase AlkB, partial [Myxococcota bacterium]